MVEEKYYIIEYHNLKDRLKYSSLPINGWIHPCICCDAQTSKYKIFNKMFNKILIKYVYFICTNCKKKRQTDQNYIQKNVMQMNRRCYRL